MIWCGIFKQVPWEGTQSSCDSRVFIKSLGFQNCTFPITSLCHKWLECLFSMLLINVFYKYLLSIWDEPCLSAGDVSAKEMWSLTSWNLLASDGKGTCWGHQLHGQFLLLLPCLMCLLPFLYLPLQLKIWEIESGSLQVSVRSYLWDFRKEGITWREVEKNENCM